MTTERKYQKGEQVETKLRTWKGGITPGKGTKYIRLVFDNYISKDLWLTAKNMENVMKTLKIFGFNGDNLGDLMDENSLDKNKYVYAIIEDSREHNGKTYYNASFINDPDAQYGVMKDTPQDLYDHLKRFDTRAYKDAPQRQVAPGPVQNTFTADDIPF